MKYLKISKNIFVEPHMNKVATNFLSIHFKLGTRVLLLLCVLMSSMYKTL